MADPEKERFTLDLALAANHSGPRRAGFDSDVEQFAAIESPELDRITAPVLIVQGTADTDVLPEYSGFAPSGSRERSWSNSPAAHTWRSGYTRTRRRCGSGRSTCSGRRPVNSGPIQQASIQRR